MKYIFTLMAICLFQFSFGQANSELIYKGAVLKRGFYKNYQEFLHNAPSLAPDFNITYLRIG